MMHNRISYQLLASSKNMAMAVFETHAKKLMAVGLVTLESCKPYAKVASSIRTESCGYFLR